jgi:hypothetical protein
MSNGFPPGPWNGSDEWNDEGTMALTESPAPGPLGFRVASTVVDDDEGESGEAEDDSDAQG